MHISTNPEHESPQAVLPFRDARMRQVVQNTIARHRLATITRTPRPGPYSLGNQAEQLNLDLPLFDSVGTVFDATYEVAVGQSAQERAEPALRAEDIPDHFDDLRIEHVARMHAKVLYRHLEQLFYARNIDGSTRREALEWIYQPAEIEHERADGSVTRIRTVFVPFTFDACCSFEQIDAEGLRAAIARRIDELRGSRSLLSNPQHKELQQ